MLPASEEQLRVVTCAREHNIVVDSVAGSGKTTTILHLALEHKDKNILLLTYNSKLKLETIQRAHQYCANNLDIYSYHSFGVKHISAECKTDVGIIKFIRQGKKIQQLSDYDIIIVDECQDMTPLYYQLVMKIINAKQSADHPANLIIFGDKYQSIYNYAGADARFIT